MRRRTISPSTMDRTRYNQCMKRCLVALAFLVTSLTAGVAVAQQVNITAPAPPRGLDIDGIINPGMQYEITRPDDSRYLPPGPRVHYDPAFIEPLSTPTETGRRGVAGWTAPTAAMGGTLSGAREVTGYFAIGFAIEWGGPPQTSRPAR
jgi:hypothetical protein